MPASDEFLGLFDPDPVLAARKCEQLCERLVWFFRRRGCSEPEDLAQDTLMRGFARIPTVALHVEAAHYFFGIAKMVVLEDRKKARRRNNLVPLIENLTADPDDPEPQDFEATPREAPYGIPSLPRHGGLPESLDEAAKLLSEGLRRLPRRDARLLIKYVRADAKGRAELARQLGISQGTLRTRCCRIQKQLKQLIRQP